MKATFTEQEIIDIADERGFKIRVCAYRNMYIVSEELNIKIIFRYQKEDSYYLEVAPIKIEINKWLSLQKFLDKTIDLLDFEYLVRDLKEIRYKEKK